MCRPKNTCYVLLVDLHINAVNQAGNVSQNGEEQVDPELATKAVSHGHSEWWDQDRNQNFNQFHIPMCVYVF
jgi:hypothetical protein